MNKPQLSTDNIIFSPLLVSVQVCVCLPMSKWRYKVETAVHPVVHNVSSVQPTLIVEVSLKLIVNVLDDGLEAAKKRQKKTLTSLN